MKKAGKHGLPIPTKSDWHRSLSDSKCFTSRESFPTQIWRFIISRGISVRTLPLFLTMVSFISIKFSGHISPTSHTAEFAHIRANFMHRATFFCGDAEHFGKATVCRTVRKVTLALKRLLPVMVVFPGHPFRTIKGEFHRIAGDRCRNDIFYYFKLWCTFCCNLRVGSVA